MQGDVQESHSQGLTSQQLTSVTIIVDVGLIRK